MQLHSDPALKKNKKTVPHPPSPFRVFARLGCVAPTTHIHRRRHTAAHATKKSRWKNKWKEAKQEKQNQTKRGIDLIHEHRVV